MISLREYLLEAFRDRSEMPQIKKPHIPEFLDYLGANGIQVKREKVSANLLSPSQAVDDDKVKSMIDNGASLDIEVFTDMIYQIIDGHHRWKANYVLNTKVNIIRIIAPWDKIYSLSMNFNKVKFEN